MAQETKAVILAAVMAALAIAIFLAPFFTLQAALG